MNTNGIWLAAILCAALAIPLLGTAYNLISTPPNLSYLAPPSTGLTVAKPRSSPIPFGSLLLASSLVFIIWANRRNDT